MCFGRLQESLTFKFNTVVALTTAAAAVAVSVVQALVFRILFIIILNATAYGRIFCTARLRETWFLVLCAAVTITIDFLLHIVSYTYHHTTCECMRQCALLHHFQFFLCLCQFCPWIQSL